MQCDNNIVLLINWQSAIETYICTHEGSIFTSGSKEDFVGVELRRDDLELVHVSFSILCS